MNTFNYRICQDIVMYMLQIEALLPYYQKYQLDVFHGHNPLTGMSNYFIFNEPIPGKAKVISWNCLAKCWFYSENAGLSWVKLNKNEVESYMYKSDVMYPSEMKSNLC